MTPSRIIRVASTEHGDSLQTLEFCSRRVVWHGSSFTRAPPGGVSLFLEGKGGIMISAKDPFGSSLLVSVFLVNRWKSCRK